MLCVLCLLLGTQIILIIWVKEAQILLAILEIQAAIAV